MTKGRLEAFSDGVTAILITIKCLGMVLELRVPHGTDWKALNPLLPVFLAYLLSFVFLGIYWNSHHYLLHAADRINGKVLWANSHLLFWLSLVAFVTAWMGKNHLAPVPTAHYGGVLFMCAIAFTMLQGVLISDGGKPRGPRPSGLISKVRSHWRFTRLPSLWPSYTQDFQPVSVWWWPCCG